MDRGEWDAGGTPAPAKNVRKPSLDREHESLQVSNHSTVKDFVRKLWRRNSEKSKKPKGHQIHTEVEEEKRALTISYANRQRAGNHFGDLEYNMNHTSRGRVYIFNHEKFKKGVATREGTNADVVNLQVQLPKLGFRPEDINCFTDLTISETHDQLELIAKDDHTEHDLIMVFVLTHGERDGRVHAYDGDYSVNNIWRCFTAENCKTLIGKPKIFFIIACRGDSMDGGTRVTAVPGYRKTSTTETDAALCQSRVTYTIPVWADFLIVYSTIEGYYSYRNPLDGTWYIQAFCNQIKNFNESNMHFMDFLTAVNRRVAVSYQTVFDQEQFSNKKQCPFVTSSLTKILNFKIQANSTDAKEKKIKQRPKSFNS